MIMKPTTQRQGWLWPRLLAVGHSEPLGVKGLEGDPGVDVTVFLCPGNLWYRAGITPSYPQGSSWEHVSNNVRKVSVGPLDQVRGERVPWQWRSGVPSLVSPFCT